jgi:molybdenum cofactor cytidylyltransferase
MSPDIRGVLLCGGRSTRFGSDKLVARLPPGSSLLAVQSARHLMAGAGNALAVVPVGGGPLRAALEGAGCQVLESERTRRGLGASLAAAIAAGAEADGWIVALGDMPHIAPDTIAAVRERLAGGALIAAPVLATGERGHPVGFSKALFEELAALDGDEGARSVIARHRGSIVQVVVADRGILVDVDTPADLAGFREGG